LLIRCCIVPQEAGSSDVFHLSGYGLEKVNDISVFSQGILIFVKRKRKTLPDVSMYLVTVIKWQLVIICLVGR